MANKPIDFDPIWLGLLEIIDFPCADCPYNKDLDRAKKCKEKCDVWRAWVSEEWARIVKNRREPDEKRHNP